MKLVCIVGTCVERVKLGYDGKSIVSQMPGCLSYYDDKMEGTLRAHSKALKMGVDAGADWVLLMQDDIILANNFYEKALKRIEEADSMGWSKVVQFFRIDPSDRPYKDVTRWRPLPIKNLMWEQANAYRKDIILEWYDWLYSDGLIDREFPHGPRVKKDGTVWRRDMMPNGRHNMFGHPGQGHDGTMAEWWYRRYPNDTCLITNPNLVQHDLDPPSTLGTGKTMYGYLRNSKVFDPNGD